MKPFACDPILSRDTMQLLARFCNPAASSHLSLRFPQDGTPSTPIWDQLQQIADRVIPSVHGLKMQRRTALSACAVARLSISDKNCHLFDRLRFALPSDTTASLSVSFSVLNHCCSTQTLQDSARVLISEYLS